MKKINFGCLNCSENHDVYLMENTDNGFVCNNSFGMSFQFTKNKNLKINGINIGIFKESIGRHSIRTIFGLLNYDVFEENTTDSDKSPNDLSQIIKEVTEYIESTNSDKYGDSPLNDMLGPDGKAINTFQIKKYLTRYKTTGFKKSELRSDLLKIIHYAMFELKRTK